MFNILKKPPLLPEESRQFQIDCYTWLLTHFGGDDFYQGAALILPTDDFFAPEDRTLELTAEDVFYKVKQYAGLVKWPVSLVAQEEDPDPHVAPTLIIQGVDAKPLGTFSANEENEHTITYNPRVQTNPTQMVATFAHELSHFLTSTSPEPPPGGWGNWEYATDICATFLGFGIFMGNSSFSFSQYSEGTTIGWKTASSGYLSEQEHAYALALFLLLKELPAKEALRYCNTNIRSYLKRALKELEAGETIRELRSVKFKPPAS